mmetsp:Transcript_7582/g.25933  ORF Transcript_7582/g.25933 Transcript_7582/m.25933 type:complete len:261 (+) Transcript_7582:1766-2548(+)
MGVPVTTHAWRRRIAEHIKAAFDLPSMSVTISLRFPGQNLSKIVTATGRREPLDLVLVGRAAGHGGPVVHERREEAAPTSAARVARARRRTPGLREEDLDGHDDGVGGHHDRLRAEDVRRERRGRRRVDDLGGERGPHRAAPERLVGRQEGHEGQRDLDAARGDVRADHGAAPRVDHELRARVHLPSTTVTMFRRFPGRNLSKVVTATGRWGPRSSGRRARGSSPARRRSRRRRAAWRRSPRPGPGPAAARRPRPACRTT